MAVLAITYAAIGALLVAIGNWGRRSVHRVVPAHLDAQERHRRGRVIVRGSWTCQFVGLFVIVMVVGVALA